MESLLSGYRVLDLTDEKGYFCGKTLGDLGCDVIKVEKVGGDQGRLIGPFYHDLPDADKSLFWFAHNTSKRGITLNIESKDGYEIFKRLVKTADFVIESFPPNYSNDIGLSYSALSSINPRIIVVQITPFGSQGPYSNYKGSDIIAQATGGLMYLCGEPDKVPVRTPAEYAYAVAGIHAAIGALMAHHYRQISGEGQHVDVSLQECIAEMIFIATGTWDLNHEIMHREGSYTRRELGGGNWLRVRVVWPCKDGYVAYRFLTGILGRRTAALVNWMNEEGMAGDLANVNWETMDFGSVTQAQVEEIESVFGRFFLAHTKKELHERTSKIGALLHPASTVEDLFQEEQLKARNFWIQVDHPELGRPITYPGIPIKSSRMDCQVHRRAPLVGEHNIEIYEDELGIPRKEFLQLRQSGII